MGPQGVADAGDDAVGAFVDGFCDAVAAAVDVVGVVAKPPCHVVVAGVAVQGVVAFPAEQAVAADAAAQAVIAAETAEDIAGAVADDGVVEFVAGAVDGPGARQGQVLHLGPQGVADAGDDAVGAFVNYFSDAVAAAVDVVGVVAKASDHRIGTQAAVERIAAAIADQQVVQCIAGRGNVGGTEKRKVLHVGRQCEGYARLDRVRAFTREFNDDVAGVIDDIDVVAGAAGHPVAPRTTVQNVVADATCQDVAAGGTRERDARESLNRQGERLTDGGSRKIGRRHDDLQLPGVSMNGSADQSPRGGFEVQPGRQGGAVGQPCRQCKPVFSVDIGKRCRRQHEEECIVLARRLVCYRDVYHRGVVRVVDGQIKNV